VNQGMHLLVYPARDLAKAKTPYRELLGVEPYADQDIRSSLRQLLDAGGEADQDVKDVGGGKLIASVKDADGNRLGLTQSP
jgi:hypothetical protein